MRRLPASLAHRAALGALVLALVPARHLAAQATPPAAPRQAPRRAIAAMTLASPAFTDGGMIPMRHAQRGRDISPALTWSGVPDSTVSFVLLVHDLDAAIGNGTDDLLHWLAWNVPGTATGLPEGVARMPELGDGTRQVSASGPYYRGPAAPATGPVHHYAFELYALDTRLDVPSLVASPPATRAAVLAAMAGHVRGKGVLVGRYRRD